MAFESLKELTMMKSLYGDVLANELSLKLEKCSPKLNSIAQRILYGNFWMRSALGLQDKIVISLVSLAVIKKFNHMERYFEAFTRSSGKYRELVRLVEYLKNEKHIECGDSVRLARERINNESGNLAEEKNKFGLPDRLKAIVDLSISIAIGNQNKTKACLREIIESNIFSRKEIEAIMIHPIMYCGFPCAMNGFAALYEILGKNSTENDSCCKKSKMMDALYGVELSERVYNRCQELSADFNQMVQEIVYDEFWAKPGLLLREKSFVTVITLLLLAKEEQLKIHLGGYLSQGGTPGVLLSIFEYMEMSGYINSPTMAKKLLFAVASSSDVGDENIVKLPFSEEEKIIIDVLSVVVNGNKHKISANVGAAISYGLDESKVELMLLHAMMYCGLPRIMDAMLY